MAKKIGRPKIDTKTLKLRGSSLVSGRLKAEKKERKVKDAERLKREVIQRIDDGIIDHDMIPKPYTLCDIRVLALGDFRECSSFGKPRAGKLTKKQLAAARKAWGVLKDWVFMYLCVRTFNLRSPDPQLLPWGWWTFEADEKRNTRLAEVEQLAKMERLGGVYTIYETNADRTADSDESMDYLEEIFEPYP